MLQINVSDKPYYEAFAPEDVVYLTSESPNTLTCALCITIIH